jgi:uncharacterized protein (TIRG00374 family)
MSSRPWLRLAKLAVGVALILVLVLRVEADLLLDRFRSLKLAWVVVVFALPPVGILLSTVRWRALLEVLGVRVGLGRLLALYMIGTFFNNFLPTMVGGDVVKSYTLARETGAAESVIAATFMERFVGLAALVTLLPLILGRQTVVEPFPALHVVVWLALGAYLVSVAIAISPERLHARRTRSDVEIWLRLRSLVERTHRKISRFKAARSTLAVSYGLSLAFYLLSVLTAWAATRSVGADVGFVYLLAVLPLVWLAGMLPISLNGLGITEGGYLVFLQLAGVEPADALTVALLLRVRLLITALLGGLIFLVYRRRQAVSLPDGDTGDLSGERGTLPA